METILFLAYTETDGSLSKPALEALGAARTLNAALSGSTLLVGLVGANVQPAANRIVTCGAKRFLGVTGTDFAASRYATDAAASEALAKAAQATLVIAAGTSRWSRVLPGVAQRLGGRADTHVTAVAATNGAVSINRWYYRQRMEAALQRKQRPWFILVDPGSQPAWQGKADTGAPNSIRLNPGPGSQPLSPISATAPSAPSDGGEGRGEEATVEPIVINLPASCQRTTVTGFREPAADAQTIRPDADLLFVAGAGWTKKQADGQTHVPEAEKLIHDFLKLTRASLGSSKSLVDQSGEGQTVLSFLTHLNQIGQTGATPRHPKGLSTCCHGEEPHTVGWRFINERRAISLDPNCGWARGKADVLYVADAFAVMKQVNQLLAAPIPSPQGEREG